MARNVLGGRKPAVWVSDRCAGQQVTAAAHQMRLARVLRDVQHAVDCADTAFAPAPAKLPGWAIAVGRRRDSLQDGALRQSRARVDRRLDRLLATSAPRPAGRILQARVKAWRIKFFVFLDDRRVSATDDVAEREIRPSVTFRKVTGGFRSQWGPGEFHLEVRHSWRMMHPSVSKGKTVSSCQDIPASRSTRETGSRV